MDFSIIARSLFTHIRRVRNLLIVVVTLYVIIQLSIGLSGWGRIGSVFSSGPTPAEKARAQIHARYLDAKKSLDPSIQLRVETVAGIACSFLGELCDDDLSKPTDKNSMLHKVANFVAMPYGVPPASGVAWLGDTLEHAGFVPKTHAQGMGFNALGSYQAVWKVMRDTAFLIITVIIVVTGFMVIFQVPIGEKASVKVEEMLPRLVLVLVMISLSYAICGFLIDMMYLSIFMSFSIMSPLLHLDPAAQRQAFQSLATGQPTSLLNLVLSDELSPLHTFALGQSLFRLLPSAGQILVSSIVYQIGLPFLATVVGSMFPGGDKIRDFLKVKVFARAPLIQVANSLSGNKLLADIKGTQTPGLSLALGLILAVFQAFETYAFPVITPMFIAALLMLTTVYLFFKIWFMLFYAYTEIIINVIFAPIFIMLYAIPGSKSMVTWIKGLCINLLIFPAVLILMMVAAYIANANAGGGTSQNFWAPPFLNSVGDQTSLQMLIGGLIFYNIPYYIEQMKKALGYEAGERPGVMSLFAPVIGFTQSTASLTSSAAEYGHKLGLGGMFGFLKK